MVFDVSLSGCILRCTCCFCVVMSILYHKVGSARCCGPDVCTSENITNILGHAPSVKDFSICMLPIVKTGDA